MHQAVPTFGEYSDERPLKRIRMDKTGKAITECIHFQSQAEACRSRTPTPDPDASSTIPSSPARREAQIFSDPVLSDSDSGLSSPTTPSSPPLSLPSPVTKARKATFSFLKRKRSVDPTQASRGSAKQPLREIAINARRKPKLEKKSSSTQMQIDLGGEQRKTCGQCKMEYIPSNREDAALHQQFHRMNGTGIEVGAAMMKDDETRSVAPDIERLKDGEAILMVDRRSSIASRRKVREILDVVDTELSAISIIDDVLWSGSEAEKKGSSKRKINSDALSGKDAKFRAFLFLESEKCVGFCLVEKIQIGYKVVEPSVTNGKDKALSGHVENSSISVSNRPEVALLGITRIWTSRSFRGRSIAATLLDCARQHFFYGMKVTKDLVAFSQPTNSGAKLARRWYGKDTGWLIYHSREWEKEKFESRGNHKSSAEL